MTVTITVEPDSLWLDEIETKLLDDLTTGQLAELAGRCMNALASRALDAEGLLENQD
jgi:hypothetical protein